MFVAKYLWNMVALKISNYFLLFLIIPYLESLVQACATKIPSFELGARISHIGGGLSGYSELRFKWRNLTSIK